MKVSIITVCYNSESTIRDTLDSVKSQTYNNIEYIVIDGRSTDSTIEIISQYEDIVTILKSEPDEGLYDAMNKGITLSTGDIVGILNSDDVFYDKYTVQKIVDGFSDGIDAVYSDILYVAENNLDKPSRYYSSKVFKKKMMRFGIMIPHPSFYVKRHFYEQLGLYKKSYRVAADFELLCRFFSHGVTAKRLRMKSVKMREGGISSSGLLWRVHQNLEIVRACKENDIYTNIFFVAMKLPYKLATYLARYLWRNKQ